MTVLILEIRCPACGEVVMRGGCGKKKLWTKVLVFTDDGQCLSACPNCKKDIELPITVDMSKLKKLSHVKYV